MADGCGCLDEVEARLAKDGHYIRRTMGSLFGGVDKPIMDIWRKDTDTREVRKNRAHSVAPVYCPWCGLKYPEAKP